MPVWAAKTTVKEPPAPMASVTTVVLTLSRAHAAVFFGNFGSQKAQFSGLLEEGKGQFVILFFQLIRIGFDFLFHEIFRHNP